MTWVVIIVIPRTVGSCLFSNSHLHVLVTSCAGSGSRQMMEGQMAFSTSTSRFTCGAFLWRVMLAQRLPDRHDNNGSNRPRFRGTRLLTRTTLLISVFQLLLTPMISACSHHT
jgi:hypothetical protein